MGRLTEILTSAQQRAKKAQLPYEGALTPVEAAEVLQLAPGSRLIDVRSRAELDLVGKIPGAVEVEWMTYPGWHPNPHFLTQLKQQVDPEALALFICRNGQRSHRAAEAATLNGYRDCYNVLEGFEGDLDKQSHQRGSLGGWKKSGLPWSQS
ncbi:MAG: rhodanese-like domain-containing protein [Hydrogenophilaceae bacterium]|jgi:rhodanese-related sulfurtransferase|nr:rhodanese-like domain-containing protein [Hydrogenophilaceae bacterium]